MLSLQTPPLCVVSASVIVSLGLFQTFRFDLSQSRPSVTSRTEFYRDDGLLLYKTFTPPRRSKKLISAQYHNYRHVAEGTLGIGSKPLSLPQRWSRIATCPIRFIQATEYTVTYLAGLWEAPGEGRVHASRTTPRGHERTHVTKDLKPHAIAND